MTQTDWSAQIAAIDRATPLARIVHVGAGLWREREATRATTARIALVEPHATRARALATVASDRVTVMPVALAPHAGQATFHEANFADLSGLHDLASLHTLFPGLRETARRTVETRTLGSLVESPEATPPGARLLILDAPTATVALVDDLLSSVPPGTFDHLLLTFLATDAPEEAEARLAAAHHMVRPCPGDDPDVVRLHAVFDGAAYHGQRAAESEAARTAAQAETAAQSERAAAAERRAATAEAEVARLLSQLEEVGGERDKALSERSLAERLGTMRAADLRALEARHAALAAPADTLPGPSHEAEPVRLLHHFACSGGTLLSRCLAALPRVLLLSEIDPLSRLHLPEGRMPFAPSDPIVSLKYDARGLPDEAFVRVFLGAMGALRGVAAERGRLVLLRDHAHSQFCTHVDAAARPTVREIVARAAPTRSALTVRHPLDSFLSLDRNGWRHFTPFTIEEYALRYMRFLDAHEDVPRFRYEDVVADPQTGIAALAAALELPFDPDFETVAPVLLVSGDSGRRSVRIESRPRRPVPEALVAAAGESAAYATLCARLDYDPAP